MNITFEINNTYNLQFDTNNLSRNRIQIQRITTMNDTANTYGLVLRNINNIRNSGGKPLCSPLVWINPGYNSEIVSIDVEPANVWKFYLIDTDNNIVNTDSCLKVNLISKLVL